MCDIKDNDEYDDLFLLCLSLLSQFVEEVKNKVEKKPTFDYNSNVHTEKRRSSILTWLENFRLVKGRDERYVKVVLE